MTPQTPVTAWHPGSATPPPVGTVVAEKYVIEALLGRGGMGAVYRAQHKFTQRRVALKWLLADDEAPVDRDGFRDGLHREGVGTGIHYAPLHRHPYYRERFGLADEHFPNASHIGSRTVSLPLSPKVTDAEVDRIIAAVRKVTGGK